MIMTKISAVLITYNEEKNIGAALQSVAFCDEIIVVDSHSTDRTLEICQQVHARTFLNKFEGFGQQKRFAVEKASNNWILSIDADEVVSEKLKEEIIAVLSKDPNVYQGYLIPIPLIFCGKMLGFPHRIDKPKLRLFNKQFGNFNKNKVHEGVEIEGKLKQMQNPLLHYSYKTISDYFEKFNRYSSFAAENLFIQGKRPSKIQIFFRFPFELIHLYLLRGYFLDGYAGLFWSLLSAFYPVVKYLKLQELHDVKNTMAGQKT